MPLAVLAGLFALAVIALSRWRGLAALGALAVCLLGLTEFVLPAIIEGNDPLVVAVIGCTVIMVVALYLTHGVNARTSVALVATVASLAITGVLGHFALAYAGTALPMLLLFTLTGLPGEHALAALAVGNRLPLPNESGHLREGAP
ncbi:YibE/F family protein [Herbihabitans rhizosphaerae]|uniref:YibE/F family protein n=1 Tax=Herbihabitans rhizosphaerae TaxID=1872711 RepID=UPI001F5FABD5|nr:YibE/F family protein [Herbihabitans rhizosphaerae]